LFDHEPVKRFCGKKSDVPILRLGRLHVDTRVFQTLFQSVQMLGGGDDYGAFSCFQSAADESR